MGKKKRRKQQHTPLERHTKTGTKLIPPLAKLPVSIVAYDRDYIPEYLWIASLVDAFGIDRAHQPFYEVLDALDAVWKLDSPPLGFITDFGHVPEEARGQFKEAHSQLLTRAFHEPIGRLLAFYPESPAYWLVDQGLLAKVGSLDPTVELPKLRNLVTRLLPGRDAFAGHARVLPFGRIMKHGRLYLPKDFDLAEVMPRYPGQCTEDESQQVQSFARTIVNMDFEQTDRYKDRTWPKYFWRHNIDLLPCAPKDIPLHGAKPLTGDDAPKVVETLKVNTDRAREYLDLLTRQAHIDLYYPERDEILLGLFARCVRLFLLMSEDANLWARDTGGIMLRCLADSAITFCYLSRGGSSGDFDAFRRYGEGQEKLLMLHLQDSHPDDESLEGRAAGAISQELGSFNPELIQIELGSWSKQDTRKLAHTAGLERLYRLVFSPTSSDVHGSWLSLKQSNLRYCAEPLHRFHRLPSLTEPPVYINVMTAAQELLQACIEAGVEVLNWPKMAPPFSRELLDLTTVTEVQNGN